MPRLVVGNLVEIAAAERAVLLYCRRQPGWDKTRHTFPKQLAPKTSG